MIAAALLLAGAFVGGDWRAALADQAAVEAAVPGSLPFLRYATTENIPNADQRLDASAGFALVLTSASPALVIERAAPVQIGPTLYRLDLRLLEISPADWDSIATRDPYRPVGNPLMSRVDWLLQDIGDARESNAYDRIVFRGVIPKNRGEAFKALGVIDDRALSFGWIESHSGVSVTGHRWVEVRPLPGGSFYLTRDSRHLTADKNPIEQPEGDFHEDANEVIPFRAKTSLATHGRGMLPVFLLFDGQQKPLDRADVQIVEDHLKFRGLSEIARPGSCIGCHARGTLLPTENELQAQLNAGVRRFANFTDQDFIGSFHLGDVYKQLERDREDYGLAVKAGCNCSPQEAADHFRAAINRYDEPLDLARMAQEHYCPLEMLRQAISAESAAQNNLPSLIAGLVQGQTIPRDAAEEAWPAIHVLLEKWAPR